MSDIQLRQPPHVPWWNEPRNRGYVYQGLLFAVLAFLVWSAVDNASTNMRARGIPTDFSFWNRTAGFDVNLTLIEFSAAASTYGRAFWVGLLNTLMVSVVSIFFATILGFIIGIARLSSNWVVARLATAYVETLRNLPLLLQLLFWYNAVLKPLPAPRESISVPSVGFATPEIVPTIACAFIGGVGYAATRYARTIGGVAVIIANAVGALLMLSAVAIWLFGASGIASFLGDGIVRFAGKAGIYLNNRGLIFPEFVETADTWPFLIAFMLGIGGALVFRHWARGVQKQTGEQKPVALVGMLLIIGLPLMTTLVLGAPYDLAKPELRGFNFVGGTRILPEFAALMFGLALYTASFIAEIVRAGILAVNKGQTEASSALGLTRAQGLKLVVVPQAMRVIIPPLTNQFLNLTKNSSLAVFIGYPDLVQVFAGTVLNQTGAAVQVIAITMAVYLVISLVTSFIMDIYNRRMALVER